MSGQRAREGTRAHKAFKENPDQKVPGVKLGHKAPKEKLAPRDGKGNLAHRARLGRRAYEVHKGQ